MLWRRAIDIAIVAIIVATIVATIVAVARTIAGGITGTVVRIVAIEIVAPVAGISSLLSSSAAAPAPAAAEDARAARTCHRQQHEGQEPLSPRPSGNRCRKQPTNGLDDPIEDFGGRHHGNAAIVSSCAVCKGFGGCNVLRRMQFLAFGFEYLIRLIFDSIRFN